MADNLETIKNKIRKLLSLSKSDNENEAAVALEKANELISKYELDETALRFESVKVKSTKTQVLWRTVVANAVSWLYGCHNYRQTNYGVFIFTGSDDSTKKQNNFNRTTLARGLSYGDDVSLARQAVFTPVPQIT